MIHHQPTKYHHANPLTHFLNLHTSHATAAAAAALALATDGLGQHHGHHPHHVQQLTGATSQQHLRPSSPQHFQHHQQMEGPRQLLAETAGSSVRERMRHRGEPGPEDYHTDEEDQDESSNDRSCPEELRVGGRKREPGFDQAFRETSQGEASESEHNVEIDVDDPDPRELCEMVPRDVERDQHAVGGEEASRTPNGDTEHNVAEREGSSFGEEEDEDEEIVIDGRGPQDDGNYKELANNNDRSSRGDRTSPCNDTNTAVLDTDGFVGKSFTIAAILGLKKKRDEAAAAAANEYSDGAMNLSTGVGFQQHQHQQQQHQRVAAAAAVAAAAMGRLPLVMAAAAAGMEKRDRADSADSVDACVAQLGYGGQHHPNGAVGAGALSALQNLHPLPGLHGAGGNFSAFHPSSGNGGGATGHPSPHQHQQHVGNHHHVHHHHQHQVNPAFAGHHFHHLQGQQQTQQQHQQHMQQHSALQHQQQNQHVPGGHHIALGPHHHSQNHNRDKFKDLGKKTTMSTSAASLKSKRVRTIFTPEQLERLEAEFERQQYMVGPERLYLAHTLQLTEAQVKVWFQNRRIKWRKHHLEITQQRLALIRQRQLASGVSIAPTGSQDHLGQQTHQGGMSGGRMINPIESPDLTICTDSMDARSASEGDD